MRHQIACCLNLLLSLALGLTLLLPLAFASGSDAPEARNAEQLSRFVRTATALAIATDDERTDFASIALTELAEAYLAEADLARHHSRELERGNKLGSWSAGVYGFVDQLVLFQENIDLGSPVELRHLYAQVIGVVSDGRTVILSHPRHKQQAAYEQRVLADFCRRHDCEQLTNAAPGENKIPIPVTAAVAQPEWEFQENESVCSHRGIHLRFRSSKALATRRGICEQLMQEAESLAAELAWQRRHGVPIDLSGLSIQATPERPEHIIRLNPAGDSILVPLPLLYSTSNLLPQLLPWLQARYDSEAEPVSIYLEATALGWE